jgi:hypothetical protein
MNITRPIYGVSTHNYAPKVAQVIKTRGTTSVLVDVQQKQSNVQQNFEHICKTNPLRNSFARNKIPILRWFWVIIGHLILLIYSCRPTRSSFATIEHGNAQQDRRHLSSEWICAYTVFWSCSAGVPFVHSWWKAFHVTWTARRSWQNPSCWRSWLLEPLWKDAVRSCAN